MSIANHNAPCITGEAPYSQLIYPQTGSVSVRAFVPSLFGLLSSIGLDIPIPLFLVHLRSLLEGFWLYLLGFFEVLGYCYCFHPQRFEYSIRFLWYGRHQGVDHNHLFLMVRQCL